jgi:mannose-6-phosphate isomerase-like protein (cupin superfamily)
METPKKINLLDLLAPHPPRTNFHVVRVDERYSVRVAKIQGRFPWHFHPSGDEGWLVFEGRVRIDTEIGAIELDRGDITVIPRGLRHSPEALIPETTVIIFNLRDLGMVLDNPNADTGGFQERDLAKVPSGPS